MRSFCGEESTLILKETMKTLWFVFGALVAATMAHRHRHAGPFEHFRISPSSCREAHNHKATCVNERLSSRGLPFTEEDIEACFQQ